MAFYRVSPEQIASIARYACDVAGIINPTFAVVFSRELAKVNAQSMATLSDSDVYTDEISDEFVEEMKCFDAAQTLAFICHYRYQVTEESFFSASVIGILLEQVASHCRGEIIRMAEQQKSEQEGGEFCTDCEKVRRLLVKKIDPLTDMLIAGLSGKLRWKWGM
ncbi:hypothetical protein HX884_04040 [Enterobacter sp. SECR19-1250]|uniref:hypothetical protein n=1 Tax=Enterobacter sp. SECR19-1250 TaxID=2749084 RepID=UPI0015B3B92F|nr:hypothetical protein [Enterobacter sp. SECR19-1250]NWJ78813.1 hypothetical protein [Enterobacter sp. SECR19-1250]